MEPPIHPRKRLYNTFDQIAASVIERVEIRYEGLDDEEAWDLGQSLVDNRSVKELNLSACNISSSGILQVFSVGLMQHPLILKINLSHNIVNVDAAAAISSFLENTTTLQDLQLHQSQMTSDAIATLAPGIAASSQLVLLRLSNNKDLSEQACRALGAAMATQATIQTLDMSCCSIGSLAFQVLQLHLVPTLVSVTLCGNKLGEGGGPALGMLLTSANMLEELNLRSCELCDSGVESLSVGLAQSRSLKKLYLSCNLISDRGVHVLAAALNHHRTLQQLYLSCNTVSNAGATPLANLITSQTSTLVKLDLYRNRISNIGAQALVNALEQNVRITDLSIGQNPIHTTSDSVSLLRLCRFYCKVNKSGRYVLRSTNVPVALWPDILASMNYQLDVRYYFLQQKPDLFMRR